jgi:3-dehydrosphinganine reductase
LLAEAVAWNNGKPIDIVWCVAGSSTPDYWVEAPLSLTRSQMDINFWGTAEMAHAILRQWCAPDFAVVPEPKHLIFTSSVLALYPVVGYGPYNPAKGAMRALADTLVQELELYPQKIKLHVIYPSSIDSPGFVRENMTKPGVTLKVEEGDPVQPPDEVADLAIKGMEKGEYFITVSTLGQIFRWTAYAGSPRNNRFVDTIMACLMPIVWLFAIPYVYGIIRNYAKQHGHPVNHPKKKIEA